MSLQEINIRIPLDLNFSELKLARDSTGTVSFDVSVVERIEQESGLPTGYFMEQPEGVVAEALVAWYWHHLAAGGARDAVADDLIAEVKAEDSAGQPYSYPPGQA